MLVRRPLALIGKLPGWPNQSRIPHNAGKGSYDTRHVQTHAPIEPERQHKPPSITPHRCRSEGVRKRAPAGPSSRNQFLTASEKSVSDEVPWPYPSSSLAYWVQCGKDHFRERYRRLDRSDTRQLYSGISIHKSSEKRFSTSCSIQQSLAPRGHDAEQVKSGLRTRSRLQPLP